jgi:D-methionine transport system permease protein
VDAVTLFIQEYGDIMVQGTIDSLVMTLASCFFAYVIGLPIGVAFHLTTPNGLHPHSVANTILGWIINIGRSIPFIILLVALIPFTRLIMGTSLGVAGAIPPLTISAAPFVARIVEQSLAEVDASLIEAAQSFGASTWQIVTKVMLREALPSLIRGVTITFINLFGYAAMAGTVGAGGLGDIAVQYGYKRWRTDVMIVAVVLCVILVIVFQTFGDFLARKLDRRKKI